MKNKALTASSVAVLVIAALLASSPESQAVADSTTVQEITAPAQETTCNSCSDCSDKLASGSWVTVTLTTDLLNIGGSCVGIILGESNVVFDCDGHTIDGDDVAVDPERGIMMLHGDNNTVMNCTVSDFSSGIYLSDTTNHTVINNTTSSNGAGIHLSWSTNTDVRDNVSNDNYTGILFENADSNAINTTVSCDNSVSDVSLDANSTGNSGDNNTCDTTSNWNDIGTSGCTNLCTGTATCNSCTDCTNKLNGTFERVLLAADISSSGTCVTFGASNVEFDCDGHSITGSGSNFGVYISGESGNSVKNCTITDFGSGIRLYNGASGNTVERNTTDSNSYGIDLSSATGNTIYLNDAGSNSQYGISVSNSSDSNTLSFNDLLCNDSGIRVLNSDSNALRFNTACSETGDDIYVSGSTGASGYSNTCDAATGYSDPDVTGCSNICNSQRCATCSDGIQSGNEEGVDCGGHYCPPCSQCSGEPGNKYAPADTVCNNAWPTSDGPNIGMNTSSDSCNLVEVCDPNLDYIIEDALLCCEHDDYSTQFAGHSRSASKISACNHARNRSYNIAFNPSTLKQCLAQYIIKGLDSDAVYMQGYFNGEWCCGGSDNFCPSGCSHWAVNPPAWEMGTAASCKGPDGATPDFAMGGHRCEYNWAWFFHTFRWREDGYWNSDTNYQSNNDSVVDNPAHASINRLSTGTCVDYSFALTTLLRKAGYSAEDVLSVDGDGHGYNLLRLPGESKWHYVDTVGNSGGGIYGGSGYTAPEDAWYLYCRKMDEGCSNDVYSASRSHCPPNSSIYGCESILRSNLASATPLPTVEPLSLQPFYVAPEQIDQTCTELNPCTEAYTATIPATGAPPGIAVYRDGSDQITLGGWGAVGTFVDNGESTSVVATVRETLVPGVQYNNLTPQGDSYEGFDFQYHEWELTIPADTMQTVVFTVTPQALGHYAFGPATVFVNGYAFPVPSHVMQVVCEPNETCDEGESSLYCPEDCSTGIQDDYCDMASDKVNDPDCQYGLDPDYEPTDDTDGDGVLDGSDDCPLTPQVAVIDEAGCACSQKICADEDPATVGRCNPTTAACENVADTDGDQVADDEDNCPSDYNPGQIDSDDDDTGDQCEIGPITQDTVLDGGTYHVYDYDVRGAVVISASNVTLDCAGATLSGNGDGYGIYVPAGVDHVTIQNCHVSNYHYGIYVDGSASNQLLDNTLEQNDYGIMLGFTSDNVVSENTAESNAMAGLYLEGSSSNQVLSNTLQTNGSLGLFIHTSPGNEVSANLVCSNPDSDFVVHDSATSSGDGNFCDQPENWNDAGTTGCSSGCPVAYIYLPVLVKNY
jgi:parallel beta-helix repeat protein